MVRGGFLQRPSPYLGLILLAQGPRQLGLAMHLTALFTGQTNGPEIQLALPSGSTPQHQAPDFLLVTELWGVFHIQVNAGERLTVDSFRVRDASGRELAGDILVESTDPMRRLPVHAAMFVLTSDRVACDGRTYTVQFEGKRNGVPFSLTRNLAIAPYLYCG